MRYFEDNRQMHAAGKFPGTVLLEHIPAINELTQRFETKSVLDYGCGDGLQYLNPSLAAALNGAKVFLYDPPAGFNDAPGKVDGVICTDVLEHIPTEELGLALEAMNSLRPRWAFFTVCCRAAKKTLPSGVNAHVTLRPLDWWQRLLGEFLTDVHVEVRETK
jgi:2-polyprenyl-3-methyl-5-hydroxy-6-metoxy-1,4-benzoquinol methylase